MCLANPIFIDIANIYFRPLYHNFRFMESAFLTAVGPQTVIKIHGNAEGLVCGLLGASVGKHKGTCDLPLLRALTAGQVAAGLGINACNL